MPNTTFLLQLIAILKLRTLPINREIFPAVPHLQLIVQINTVLTIKDRSLGIPDVLQYSRRLGLFVERYLATNKIPFFVNMPCHNKIFPGFELTL